MSYEKFIRKDAIRVARGIVEQGFWNGHVMICSTKVIEIARSATLWYADLEALEELVGRKLTRNDHRIWERSLRADLMRLAPVDV